MRQTVVVIGAGVGGLTAAHELVERGFDVHVYERRAFAGGKAASVRVKSPTQRDPGLPGEHGFRFFPSWYRHLPDTLKKIPFRGRREYYEGATVHDNLVAADVNLLTWHDRDPVPLPMHAPRSAGEVGALAGFVKGLQGLGLAQSEVTFFLAKLMNFMMTPEEVRVREFQKITWWDYVEAASRSDAYKSLVSATTRTMVAAKATEACAYTIGKLALRTLFDSVTNVDRVLNGPTNEVWIDPWVAHLKSRGVVFHFGKELESIDFKPKDPSIASVSFSWALVNDLRRLRALLRSLCADCQAILEQGVDNDEADGFLEKTESITRQRRTRIDESLKLSRSLVKSICETLEHLRKAPQSVPELGSESSEFLLATERQLKAFSPALESLKHLLTGEAHTPPETSLREADAKAIKEEGEATRVFGECWSRTRGGPAYSEDLEKAAEALAEAQVRAQAERARSSGESPTAYDYPDFTSFLVKFVTLQNPGSSVRQLERSLPNDSVGADYFVFSIPVEQLAYYVNRSGTLTFHDPGLEKIVELADATDWMAGVQFYLRQPIDVTAGHIIGMDSEWGITAIEQTQFWRDISVPADTKSVVSVDVAAWDRPGHDIRKEAYNCSDEEIAKEVWAQLKAGLNRDTRQRVLRDSMLIGGKLSKNSSYHIDDSIVDLLDRKKQGAYERARSVRFSQVNASPPGSVPSPPPLTTPYVWGPRLRYNAEPLLVNRVGTHALRPEAKSSIRNLFLASDYVRTETDLACMEGANEAARRAVNAILDAAGSSLRRCELWPFLSTTALADTITRMMGLSGAANPAAFALKSASSLADGALGMAAQAMGAARGFFFQRK